MGRSIPSINNYLPTAITGGGSTSAAINLNGQTPTGLRVPAGLASTSLTFEVSDSLAGTYTQLRDTSNNALSITTSNTAAQYALNPANFAGVDFIRIKTGSNEASNPVFQLIVRGID